MSVVTYDDYLKGAQPNIKDTSKSALNERGKYLTEYIDKIPNKLEEANMQYALDDPGSRILIPAGPGSGKTTAMRQLVVDTIEGSLLTGVVAFNRISDVHLFYYDVISQATYKGYLVAGPQYVLTLTSSPEDEGNYVNVLKAKWVITTHARLLIEPESILYHTVDAIARRATRDVLFIDEIPANMYKKTKFINVVGVDFIVRTIVRSYLQRFYSKGLYGKLIKVVGRKDDDTEEDIMDRYMKFLQKNDQDQLRSTVYSHLVALFQQARQGSPSVRRSVVYLLADKLVAFTDDFCKNFKSKIKSMMRGYNENAKYQDLILAARLSDFIVTSYLMYEDCSNSSVSEHLDDYPYIYYSIYGLAVNKIVILDGTSDISLKNTDWKVAPYYPAKIFKRKMIVDKLVPVDTTEIKRTSPVEKIVKVLSDRVLEIANRYDKNTQFLVYVWKNAKVNSRTRKNLSADEVKALNLIPRLEGVISKKYDHPKNIHFISYQSGNERVTSKYKDSSVAIILGDYFIPEEVARDLQISNMYYRRNDTGVPHTEDMMDHLHENSEENLSRNWTLSLMIQFLYRTRTRVGKSIDLYIDTKYGDKMVGNLLRSIGLTKDPVIETSPIGKRLLSLDDLLFKNNGKIEITANELKKVLDYHSKDNNKLENKLKKSGYLVKKFSETKSDERSTHKVTKFLISTVLENNSKNES